MKALDVGSGSGYLTVCFALMVNKSENKKVFVSIHINAHRVRELRGTFSNPLANCNFSKL
jgi:protein-L-isoaspartate O-methyltransferase